jgi:hypothetical protein
MIPEQKQTPTEQHASPSNSQPVEKESLVMWQVGQIKDMNREFDIAYWQAQDATARLRAGWELVEFYHKLKGTTDELRLHRTVEALQRK